MFLLVALAACGPTYHIALTPEHASAISSTRVHAAIAQEEVEAAVEVANNPVYGFGLLGALVGAAVDVAITSHREGKAAELLWPIRKQVSDFDFRNAFFTSLQQTLPSLRVLRTAHLTTSKLPLTPDLRAIVRARAQENTLLSLFTRYEFSTDFRTFSIRTRAEISRTGSQTADEGPLYLSTFLYVTDPIVAVGDADEAARAWAANSADAFRAAMLEGIEETMKMLVIDLGGSPRAGGNAGSVAASVAAPGPRPRREIVRRSNGIMYSVSREEPAAATAAVSSNQ